MICLKVTETEASVWTKRTQSLHWLKRNFMNSALVKEESSLYWDRKLKPLSWAPLMTKVNTVKIKLSSWILIKLRVWQRMNTSPTFQMDGCNVNLTEKTPWPQSHKLTVTSTEEQAAHSICAPYVGKISKLGEAWNFTWKFTRVRNFIAANTAGRSLLSAHRCRGTFVFTRGRSLMNVVCAGKDSMSAQPWKSTTESTQVKSRINARLVKKLSPPAQTWRSTRHYILK